MKSSIIKICLALNFLTPVTSLAAPTLNKALDGYVVTCSSELSRNQNKLMSLSLEDNQLVIQTKVCIGSRMVDDIQPRVRKSYNDEGIEITEQFYDFKAVLISQGVEPITVELKSFWHTGRAVINLDDVMPLDVPVTEIFVTAQKEILTKNGGGFNAGIVSWGAYILK